MNKKEIQNLKNLIQIEARAYFYSKDYSLLRGIERTCNFLEYENFYSIANKEILKNMLEHNVINRICYDSIINTLNCIEKHFKIGFVINRELLIQFYHDIEIFNDEIKYIDEEDYNYNCKNLNIIYKNILSI